MVVKYLLNVIIIGEIIAVYIDADNDTRAYDVKYSSEAAYVDIDNSKDNFEFGLSNDRYDFEKVLELAKRIFGEKPAPQTEE